MLSVRKVSEVSAPSTCNCLLPFGSAKYGKQLDVIAGCYEHVRSSHESIHGGYRGFLTGYVCEVSDELGTSLHEKSLSLDTVATVELPGIFDLTTSYDGTRLMASCTDGSVRLLSLQDGSFNGAIFPIHNTMLTSCSPFYASSEVGVSQDKWLCTAHQGAVVVYDPVTKNVISTLEKHDYDAWCSATIGPETALSGGDDGLLKWRDIRCGVNAVGRMQFGAGVVSVAPVAEAGVASTYVLVGSYDEGLYLVDSRSQKQPVSSIGLGGGVWRCSRQLSSEGLPTASESAMRYHRWVQPRSTLAIPVMQRGVAFVKYSLAAPEEDTFSFLGHLHDETGTSEVAGLPPNALFYDCAFLPRGSRPSRGLSDDTASVVTCDFYNKKIALWEVSGLQGDA
ncbi:WD-40containing protein [Trypanosoma conorhini]|uniref:WD-40containing protein n=1 Tax=Trypanosoma conorhini TaxID=83891 RepID=A0A3R7SB62_9TRYP|nr:WD-40containing protein [Trypanosoma conorhini]RNF27429.1 WD-40containing protein [Trypanosoma conorhini]